MRCGVTFRVPNCPFACGLGKGGGSGSSQFCWVEALGHLQTWLFQVPQTRFPSFPSIPPRVPQGKEESGPVSRIEVGAGIARHRLAVAPCAVQYVRICLQCRYSVEELKNVDGHRIQFLSHWLRVCSSGLFFLSAYPCSRGLGRRDACHCRFQNVHS